MDRVIRFTRANLNTIVGISLVLVLLASYMGQNSVSAHHEPANKTSSSGSDIDEVNDATPILSETMRVSSPQDAIISVSAECSILTQLATNNNNPSSTSHGAVRLWVTIDGRRVPVSTDDTAVDGDDEVPDPNDTSDIGEITFCNRTYSRTVEDRETPPDGVDAERDFIRTRTANAFNWMAFNLGTQYDDPNVPAGAGNNIIHVQLWADYDELATGHPLSLADGFVGSRTMIVEPTNVSNHEQVQPQGGSGN